jgi:uncharacterized protein YqeY
MKENYLIARKTKDSVAVALLSSIISDVSFIAKNQSRDVTEEDVVQVLKKFLKSANETIALCGDYPAPLIEKTIIEGYLPVQLDADDIEILLERNVFWERTDQKYKAVAMKYLRDNFNGQYDGKVASDVINKMLAAD